MARYLVEFRFQSKRIRTYLKDMIHGINRKFGVGKRNHVPHITLVGPIETNNETRLISDFARICSETRLMKFKGNGFGTFDNNRVVFVNIEASEELNDFRIKLSDTLRKYCKLQSQDKKKEKDMFRYHLTLAMNLNQNEFLSIKNYIKNRPPPRFTQITMRVTLLRNGKILKEYDFLQRRLLQRSQALNKHITKRSKILLQRFMKGTYDQNKQIKISPIIEVHESPSLFRKIATFFTGK